MSRARVLLVLIALCLLAGCSSGTDPVRRDNKNPVNPDKPIRTLKVVVLTNAPVMVVELKVYDSKGNREYLEPSEIAAGPNRPYAPTIKFNSGETFTVEVWGSIKPIAGQTLYVRCAIEEGSVRRHSDLAGRITAAPDRRRSTPQRTEVHCFHTQSAGA